MSTITLDTARPSSAARPGERMRRIARRRRYLINAVAIQALEAVELPGIVA